jgi:hypothetical protein
MRRGYGRRVNVRTMVGGASVIVAVIAGGCSDGDDESSDPTAAVTVAPTAPEDAPIGAVTPTTVDNQAIGPPSPDELDPPPMPRACFLLTSDEVADIIGVAPAAFGEAGRGGVVVCRFTDAADQRLATVRIITAEGKPSPAETFDQLEAAADAEPVDGFGDEALWAEDALHVVVGDELVTFTVFPAAVSGAEAIRAATMEMATLVMPRFTPPAD